MERIKTLKQIYNPVFHRDFRELLEGFIDVAALREEGCTTTTTT